MNECTRAERPACTRAVTVVFGRVMNLLEAVLADERKPLFVSYYDVAGVYGVISPSAKDLCNRAKVYCQSRGISYVDLYPVFAGEPSYIGRDKAHPSPEGSEAIADAIISEM